MTTRTNQAPTEAEIRAAVAGAVIDCGYDIGDAAFALAAPIRYLTPAEDPEHVLSTHCLWDDLRPSQAERLSELMEEIFTKGDLIIEQEVLPRIRGLVAEAALTFAAEFPDAPRATREAVTA